MMLMLYLLFLLPIGGRHHGSYRLGQELGSKQAAVISDVLPAILSTSAKQSSSSSKHQATTTMVLSAEAHRYY
jgi:hypothetical protein